MSNINKNNNKKEPWRGGMEGRERGIIYVLLLKRINGMIGKPYFEFK